MEVKKVKSRQRHSNHKQVNETMRKREEKKKWVVSILRVLQAHI